MKLNDLLRGVSIVDKTCTGVENPDVLGLTFDSRKVEPGSLFFAVRGEHSDGHDFIGKAVEKGARVVVCETMPENACDMECVFVRVENSQLAMAYISSSFYGNPSRKLKLVGVTGTNGKTTVATLLYRLFMELGYKTGLLSTIENRICDMAMPTTHTTLDSISLNKLLNEMVAVGCDYCFMEVSSHAVVQHRVAGLCFAGGVFTNLTHDHLDYHKTFAEYLKAKKLFFDDLPKSAFAITNVDDKNGEVMLQNTKALKRSYSMRGVADFKCIRLENGFDGMLLLMDGKEMWTNLVGNFNAYNLLAIYSVAVLLDQNKEEVLMAMSKLMPAEGRFDLLKISNGRNVIVDYAHTPDALVNVLDTINEINEGRGKVITVVGAGGDRDKSKRVEMAQVSIERSDVLILTSDNPRTENPIAILDDMQHGLRTLGKKLVVIENRREAIKVALMLANAGDIVLIAGKGHEKYQEINGVKHHFDDKEEVVSNGEL